MTRKILLALLCCSVGLSGCERLSEKDKMDMIAKCDTEARKKFKEKSERDFSGNSLTVEVTTHYSFSDSQCYALKETSIFTGSSFIQFEYSLFEGLTEKNLLTAGCTTDQEQKTDECFTEGGGFASGILVKKIYGKAYMKGRYKEGRDMIEERMNRP